MNRAVLQQKLEALAAFPGSDARLVEKLGQVLEQAGEWDLLRINPLAFAARHGFEQAAAIDLFIRGAKIGLFDFEWNMICPTCGGVEYSHAAIHEIEVDHFHCTLCNTDVGSELDHQVEVAFSLSPAIAALGIDPYATLQDYWRYYFSANFSWPQAMADYMFDESLRMFEVVEADDEARLSFEAQAGQLFRLLSVEHHAGLELHFGEGVQPTPQVVDVDLLASGFSPTQVSLPAGAITIHVHNRLAARAGLMLLCIDRPRIISILQHERPRLAPFFTGKMLINTQTFRDLYRLQNLPYDLKLKVSNVTILFTDLRGSTELYDATGDFTAYNLVQEHFELLKASARAHAGAVIKTMGDAIMASFSAPLDGVVAAADMMRTMDVLRRRPDVARHPIGLKIGLHVGPALAVNANESLDYFGQTVNVASRVQGLAYAGEIWLTQAVYDTPGVQEAIVASGYQAEKKEALLKGVSQSTTVYKCA